MCSQNSTPWEIFTKLCSQNICYHEVVWFACEGIVRRFAVWRVLRGALCSGNLCPPLCRRWWCKLVIPWDWRTFPPPWSQHFIAQLWPFPTAWHGCSLNGLYCSSRQVSKFSHFISRQISPVDNPEVINSGQNGNTEDKYSIANIPSAVVSHLRFLGSSMHVLWNFIFFWVFYFFIFYFYFFIFSFFIFSFFIFSCFKLF